jgi:hypothetical protein
MAHLYFLLTLTALVLLALVRHLLRQWSQRIRFPYRAADTLLNPPQRALKNALEQAVGGEYRIYGQVRVADVINLHGRLSRAERQRAQAQLAGLTFDCLICSQETTALAGAVNLVPPRHRWWALRQHRRLQRICAAAGLPLLCFEERELKPVAALERQIFAVLQTRWLGIKTLAPDLADEPLPVTRREPVLTEFSPIPVVHQSSPTTFFQREEINDSEPVFWIDPNLEAP